MMINLAIICKNGDFPQLCWITRGYKPRKLVVFRPPPPCWLTSQFLLVKLHLWQVKFHKWLLYLHGIFPKVFKYSITKQKPRTNSPIWAGYIMIYHDVCCKTPIFFHLSEVFRWPWVIASMTPPRKAGSLLALFFCCFLSKESDAT